MRCFNLVTGLLLAAAGIGSASGATINLNFDNGSSTSPNFDSNGQQLMSIMREAADRWEDILENNHTLDVNVQYANLANTTLADALVLSENGAGTRTTKGRIRFNGTGVNPWYFDPTPGDDSEFNLVQKQIVDLPFSDWTDDFRANTLIEPLLEIEYTGTSNGSDSLANNRFDALSTAMHELGHLLGITRNLTAGANEIADQDFDLPPSLLGGRSMAAITELDDEGKPSSHLQHTGALLDVSSGRGVRTLPSALDVLAAASVSEWTQVDLQRQDFLKGTSWSTPGNWVGNQVPGSADDAFIRGEFNDLIGTGDVLLDQNDSVRNLFVGRSSNLRTGSNRLDVSQNTTIEFGGDFPFSQIFVEEGGELETGTLNIDGGELDMEGGLADIQSRLNNNDGNITGFGTVDVQTQLMNNGTITATDGGTLTFSSSSTGNVFVADGQVGAGRVRATGGNIVFSGNIDPTFSGDMEVDGGQFIEINNAWRLTPAGTLKLDGTATERAIVRGAAVELEGVVNASQRARIDADVKVDGSAQINLANVDDRLELGSTRSQTITYAGGSITGNGILVQNGDAVVEANRTQVIDADRFDWDGTTGSSTTVNSGGRLIINSSQLTDVMDGEVTLFGSQLTVNTDNPWQMRDTLSFVGNGSQLDGSPIDLVSGGVLDFAAGSGSIDSDAEIAGKVAVDVKATGEFNGVADFASSSETTVGELGLLKFNGPTFYRGGSLTGAGTVQQNGFGTVLSDQSVSMTGVFDWDGAKNDSGFEVASGRSFNLNASSIGPSNDLYSGHMTLRGGLINVNVDSDRWTMFGTMDLETGKGGEGSVVLGDALDVRGTVNARGSATHFFAAPSRMMSASRLMLQSGASVHFNAPVSFISGTHGGFGEIAVNDSGTLTNSSINVDRFEVGGSASFDMQGGTLRTKVLDPTTGDFNFEGGRLSADLVQGSLLNDGGTLAPGPSVLSVGRTVVNGDYSQTDAGELEIQLASNVFDDLKVVGQATLNGVLDVSLLGTYTPLLGDAFDIVTSNGLSGMFSDLLLPALENGLEWNLRYGTFDATLEVIASVLPGDYNDDGIVDTADYTVWRDSLGQSVLLAGDTTPGQVTQEDYEVWKSNFGTDRRFDPGSFNQGGSNPTFGSGNNNLVATPEPAGGLLMLLLIAATACIRRR